MVLGAVLGGIHLVWSLLVAFSLAQGMIDFMFRLHFIQPVFKVGAFDAVTAVTLVAVTALVGYIIGHIFGVVWNKVHR